MMGQPTAVASEDFQVAGRKLAWPFGLDNYFYLLEQGIDLRIRITSGWISAMLS